jgi:hypothetical protein
MGGSPSRGGLASTSRIAQRMSTETPADDARKFSDCYVKTIELRGEAYSTRQRDARKMGAAQQRPQITPGIVMSAAPEASAAW